MAGFSLAVDLSAADTLAVVTAAARRLNFSVLLLDQGELSVRKGGMFRYLLAGPALVPCDFRISLRTTAEDKSQVIIQPNRPWWTGIWGLRRVRARAEELADAIASDLRECGAKVVQQTVD
jgi:hypothetical protein